VPDSPPASGRIFISYRREETAYPAGWLYNRLADRFGGQVFKDVDSIELGDDFVEAIAAAVGSCDVLLALIGDEWLTIGDGDGKRRLDDPADFVRLEIEAALARDVLVIPILVDGATMPSAEELPPSLAALSRRQALELSPARFEFDFSRLLKVLEKTLDELRTDADALAVPEAAAARGRREWLSTHRTLVAGGIAALLALLVVGAIVARSINSGGEEAVIFEDDFSSEASRWSSGQIADGKYRLDFETEPGTTGSSEVGVPRNASAVYPSAPGSISIEVDAQRLSENDPQGAYGIVCRHGGGRAYSFTIWGDHVAIAKYGVPDPDAYTELVAEETPDALDDNGVNRLRSTCKDDGEQVLLDFWVNDRLVAAAIDVENQIRTGAVGLTAATGENGAVEAEFDNFEVTDG
jgi:TIR domain